VCRNLSDILQLSAVNECSTLWIFTPSSGKVSIAAACQWIEPIIDSNEEEEEAASRVRQMNVS
jgi:hypothetical protein